MGSYLDTFNILDQCRPFEQCAQPQPVAQKDDNWIPRDMDEFMRSYQEMLHRPTFIPNSGGYLSPFAGNGFGGTTQIMETLTDQFQLGEEKIDPNRIFSSDIASMKTLAADQQKVVNMFKKKFVEGISERGKVGLNEDDIEAMQALTSAVGGILAIKKEEAAIKAKITEMKIKQQQNAGGSSTDGVSTRSASPYDMGKSFMDSIFNVPQMQQSTPIPDNSYTSVDLDSAASMLESVVSPDAVSASIQYENEEPTTYVVVGDTDADATYETYSKSGDLLPDYPNPTAKITSIDRKGEKAQNELMVTYKLKIKE